jgi:hypothetical protein
MPDKVYLTSQWEALLQETFSRIRALAALKGGEYSGDLDRLANFRQGAEDQGLLPEQVWRVYAGKHWDAIGTYIRDLAQGVTRLRLEGLEGRADDLIVYLILFKAMLEERSVPKVLPEGFRESADTPVTCTHQWHRLTRFVDTCVFCNAMRDHRSKGS